MSYAGRQFGLLTVLALDRSEQSKTSTSTLSFWRCQCTCGRTKVIRLTNLISGRSRSCGCIRRKQLADRNRTHDDTGSPEYVSWSAMIQRCTNQKNKDFRHYGGRGIKVCPRWHRYSDFLADMGRRPTPEHTLERENNDGDYEPLNTTWATRAEQSRNRRKLPR